MAAFFYTLALKNIGTPGKKNYGSIIVNAL